jgi:hypothetical protein
MTTLQILEAMPEEEFQKFFQSLPARVQLLVNGGLCDWKIVLPQWYEKKQEKIQDPDQIPF